MIHNTSNTSSMQSDSTETPPEDDTLTNFTQVASEMLQTYVYGYTHNPNGDESSSPSSPSDASSKAINSTGNARTRRDIEADRSDDSSDDSSDDDSIPPPPPPDDEEVDEDRATLEKMKFFLKSFKESMMAKEQQRDVEQAEEADESVPDSSIDSANKSLWSLSRSKANRATGGSSGIKQPLEASTKRKLWISLVGLVFLCLLLGLSIGLTGGDDLRKESSSAALQDESNSASDILDTSSESDTTNVVIATTPPEDESEEEPEIDDFAANATNIFDLNETAVEVVEDGPDAVVDDSEEIVEEPEDAVVDDSEEIVEEPEDAVVDEPEEVVEEPERPGKKPGKDEPKEPEEPSCSDMLVSLKPCYELGLRDRDPIAISFQKCEAHPENWVGVYAANSDPKNLPDVPSNWSWTCNSRRLSDCGGLATSFGVLPFNVEVPEGRYQAYFFDRDEPAPYKAVSVSQVFEVKQDCSL